MTCAATPVDLSDPATWPPAVTALLRNKAEILQGQSGDALSTIDANDLDFDDVLEAALREALSRHQIRLYHATRLLPEEVAVIRTHGLSLLDTNLRDAKLRVAQRYARAEEVALLVNPPWHGDTAQERARIGKLCLFGPLAMAKWDTGLRYLWATWGGEWVHFGADTTRREVISRLTACSKPAVIEVSIPTTALHPHSASLWPTMLGAMIPVAHPGNEWHLTEAVPPGRVLDIIQPGQSRWDSVWLG